MPDMAPTSWTAFSELGTFDSWDGLVNAKWEDQAGVNWDPGIITVSVAIDAWDSVKSTTLTGWKTDDFNP